MNTERTGVESIPTLMGEVALQIDVSASQVRMAFGYTKGLRAGNGLVRGSMHRSVGSRQLFLRGVFRGDEPRELVRWLERFDDRRIFDWSQSVSGDFHLVVWDPDRRRVSCLTDARGLWRAYVHASDGVVTVTEHLADGITLARNPALDSFGVFTYLRLGYPLNPYTLLKSTRLATWGEIVSTDGRSLETRRYYEPVAEEPALYGSEKECLSALDTAYREYFSNLPTERTPLLMLSGGVDSVLMLYYLRETGRADVEALTFTTEGQHGSEWGKAHRVARYFGVPHHRLEIPLSRLDRLLKMSWLTSDDPGPQSVALREWYAEGPQAMDVLRGEDTRVHTPPLDGPKRLAWTVHRRGWQSSSAGQVLRATAGAMRRWPIRHGRNYLGYVAGVLEPRPGLQPFLLAAFLRYDWPPDGDQGPLHKQLAEGTRLLAEPAIPDRQFRRIVLVSSRLQLSEDANSIWKSVERSNARVLVPHQNPRLLRVLNRVPVKVSMKPILTFPRNTGGPFPVVHKYLPRKLMYGHVPQRVALQRKAAPGAEDVLYERVWERTLRPVLKAWGEELLGMLKHEENTAFVRKRRNEVLETGAKTGETPLGPVGLRLAYLSVLGWRCRNPSKNVDEVIDALNDLSATA